MRTYFEPDDAEAFEAAKDLLIRRLTTWADDNGEAVDPFTVAAALDFRHDSIDGRLGYWTATLVREFLLSHAPRKLSIDASDAAALSGTLRVLVRYLHASGLADPTGDPPAAIEAAITAAAPGVAAALADERNFGVAKFWVMSALAHGVDPVEADAMREFSEHVAAGRIDYDPDVLAHIVARHNADGGGGSARAIRQLPVLLPDEAELAGDAAGSPVVDRLRKLVEWVGDGRALTSTGNLRLADARELVCLLDTGDVVDPVIGDRAFRTVSSAELPGLGRLLETARKIRVVRVVKGRLVRVAKAAPLLRDSLALWTAVFDARPELGLLPPAASRAAAHTRMLDGILGEVLPDVLNTLYGLPAPMPLVRLSESVWAACAETYFLDDLDPAATTRWREGVAADLRRLLGELAELGAVELTVGRPDPMFRADLDLADDAEDGPALLPPDTLARLRAALAPDAGAMELVSLTPRATRAVRARLLREGRYAPRVGELAGAEPAQLLGMLAEHYSPETAEAEIAGWLAAHGGPEHGRALLLDGIRACPFRSRAAAMLDVLAETTPDRFAFLRGVRADPRLGPIAVQLLLADGALGMDELDDREAVCSMAEQFIQMLETHGPDGVTAVLDDLPAAQAGEMRSALRESGHPDRVGLHELDAVFRPPAAPRRFHAVSARQRNSRPGRSRTPRRKRR